MKTKKYYLVKNEVKFLWEMGFDEDDILKMMNYSTSHNLMLHIIDGGATISVTPTDADYYFYILKNEQSRENIDDTVKDIQEYINNGSIIEV